ncbi:unconventional myosin-If-like isoform X1 [Oculina patagonica]
MKTMAKAVGEHDMTALQDISVEGIAENLKERLKAGIIYTYIGRVLIAVNPFKALEIYGPDVLEMYCEDVKIDKLESEMSGITVPLHRDRVSRCSTAKLPAFEPHRRYVENIYNHKEPNPPHIYALSNNMYHNMMIEKENQCVIISGESGAGKTVSAKHIINFMNKVSGMGSERVEQVKDVIFQSNSLLEAFGNAKTMRNNNSSRFGKFLEIQFNEKSQPDGGKIYTFLLEKSRVVGPARHERNFHVFYQMLRGCTQEEKGHFGLQGKAEDYYYLKQSGVYMVDDKDDREDYMATKSAMSVVGLDAIKQKTIFQLLSAILHLGNIEFKENGSVASPTDEKLLQSLAQLLGVNKENLQERLVSVTMETRWGGRVEITKNTNNKDQAVVARDALAKALYSHLFDYLVQVMNDAMQKEKDYLCIGILDICGFETFKENGFEQFAINYVNEKLQQVFVELTLKIEQEEYVREGISWKPVEYFNNKIVCELIESKRPAGIMAVLDDSCNSLHTATEESEKTFLRKMRDIAGSNKDYSGLLQPHDDYFTVKHCAGNVDYETKSFCKKNKDELPNDMISLMQSSENAFVRDLFPETVYAGGRVQKASTGCAKIKCQTSGVIGKIMACTPHYVRCIKPSENKVPLDWNQQRVIHQIAYLGLKECLAIRKEGFAVRREFNCIDKRYGIIASKPKQRWTADQAEGCRFILRAAGIDSDKWKIGKTKLFLRETDTLHDLENIKNQHLSKFCVIIQKHYRRYRQMKQYKKMKEAVIFIQRRYRVFRRRKALEFRRHSFVPRMQWKPPKRGTLADIVEETMELKHDKKRPSLDLFTTLIKTTFGPSGGGVYCKGITLDIADGSLTTDTKEVCLQICNCKDEVAPLISQEHFASPLVAMGPVKDPLKAPAKLCMPLQGDLSADQELLLRWSPTQVGEPARWRDVLPGMCKGVFAGPTARLQIVSAKQAKISINTFGLVCIIARETTKVDAYERDNGELNTGGFLTQGISEIIRLVGHKMWSETSDRADPDREEQIALIR